MDVSKNMIRIFIVCILFSVNSFSQDKKRVRNCATDEYNKLLLEKYPEMKKKREALEKQISEKIFIQSREGTRRVVYTIPVVVHVIHNGEPIGTGPNISDAQVLSQIQVLNDDFRRVMGTRGYNTHPDGADVEVEFCLAKQTPTGCTTNGINRIDMSATSTSWGGADPSSNTNTILKPSTIWDSSKYLNMWTVNFSDSSLLGFAQFPGGSATTDGVVMGYKYFGSDDDPNVDLSGSTPFHLGRTTTHEVGHYLNLYHTFQGGCLESGGGDLCADTPAVSSSSSNSSVCIPNNSCPAGDDDMIENYMDYSSDACMNIFTNDQKARVVATLTTAANRPTTATSNVCNSLTAVNDDASIDVEKITTPTCAVVATPTVRVTNWGTNTLTSVTITYDVNGGTPSNYNWTGSLNNGEYELVALPDITGVTGSSNFNVSVSNPNGNSDLRSCNDNGTLPFSISPAYTSTTQVHLNLVPDDYGSEITWEFRNSGGALLYNGGPYTDGNTTPINQSFNVSTDECYTFTIFDSQNDGICCGYGTGSYELRTDDNILITSGGEYAASEATKISTISLSTDDYFNNNKVSVYPNPTFNSLTIKLINGNNLPNKYEVYNLLGQSLKKKEVSNILDLNLDVTSLSNGMYFIKVYKNGNSISLPFIKK